MRVIGFAGLKGSGKDVFADRLSFKLQQLGVWCLRKAFADAVKDVLGVAFRFTGKQMSDPALKEAVDERWGISPRQGMRKAGEAFREMFGPDFWIKRMLIDIRAWTDTSAVLLVTDVRNDVEAEWVKRQGKLIRVSRSQVLFDGHNTEEMGTRPASFFDYTVDNSGTLEELTEHAEVLTRQLLPWLQTKEEVK